MADYSQNLLKKLCCTCLSKDRKLSQLCRINDGVNNLYLLLSYDSEAYREGFYKDTANLYICWECNAIVKKISRFRLQACIAQKHLTDIADGRININSLSKSLSQLTRSHNTIYKSIKYEVPSETIDNFIDCGPAIDIKTESDDDIPLSEFMTERETEKDITESMVTNKQLHNTNMCLESELEGVNDSNIQLETNIQNLYDPRISQNTNLNLGHVHTIKKTKKTGHHKKPKFKIGTKFNSTLLHEW